VLITSPDEFSREPSSFLPSMDGDEQPIEPISDIGLDRINDVMFNDVNS
jgi:phosphatidylinositol glycan class P protein